MKKTVFLIALVSGLALIIACRTQPAPAQPELSTEDAFRNVYERFHQNLILDGAEVYTVVSGDYLARIARHFYHSSYYFPIIMLASKDVVLDPDKIMPGMQLNIPNLQANLDDPVARANIKDFLAEIAAIEDERNRPQDAEALRGLAASL